MSDAYIPPPIPTTSQGDAGTPKEDPKLTGRYRIGAGWLVLVGALTLLHAVLLQFRIERMGPFSLAIMYVLNGVLLLFKNRPLGIALSIALSLLVFCVFLWLGLQSTKRVLWAYWLGIGLYLLDSLLFVFLVLNLRNTAMVLVPFLFRLYVSYQLISGALALGRLKAANPAV